jgi:septal ring factor EnvC (AmiA/AmiB activator)
MGIESPIKKEWIYLWKTRWTADSFVVEGFTNMKQIAFALAVLVVAFVASAQLSPEDAQKKLAEINARAATRPSDDAIELRRVVADQKKQIEALKAEVSELTSQLEDMATKEKKLAYRRTGPDVADDIKKGMTRNEVLKIMGRQPSPEETNGDEDIATWNFVAHPVGGGLIDYGSVVVVLDKGIVKNVRKVKN